MKAYKLTDENHQTRNETQWGENITHYTNGEGELCGPGWLHYYNDPLLAVLLNPVHAGFLNPVLWECEVVGVTSTDSGLKFGATELTTLRIIPIQSVTLEQRVRFAILCAQQVDKSEDFNIWAYNWLIGSDRSEQSAYAAAESARATISAVEGKWGSLWAARAAEYAARPLSMPAAGELAGAAVESAARGSALYFDLIKIAQQACS